MRHYLSRDLLIEFDQLTDLLENCLDASQLPDLYTYSKKLAIKESLAGEISTKLLREATTNLQKLLHEQSQVRTHLRNVEALTQESFRNEFEQNFVKKFSKNSNQKELAENLLAINLNFSGEQKNSENYFNEINKQKFFELIMIALNEFQSSKDREQRKIATMLIIYIQSYENGEQRLPDSLLSMRQRKQLQECYDARLKRQAITEATIKWTLHISDISEEDAQPVAHRFKCLQVNVWQHMQLSLWYQFVEIAIQHYLNLLKESQDAKQLKRIAKIVWYRLKFFENHIDELSWEFNKVKQKIERQYGEKINSNNFKLSQQDEKIHDEIIVKIQNKENYLKQKQFHFCHNEMAKFNFYSSLDLAVAGTILLKQRAICERLLFWDIPVTQIKEKITKKLTEVALVMLKRIEFAQSAESLVDSTRNLILGLTKNQVSYRDEIFNVDGRFDLPVVVEQDCLRQHNLLAALPNDSLSTRIILTANLRKPVNNILDCFYNTISVAFKNNCYDKKNEVETNLVIKAIIEFEYKIDPATNDMSLDDVIILAENFIEMQKFVDKANKLLMEQYREICRKIAELLLHLSCKEINKNGINYANIYAIVKNLDFKVSLRFLQRINFAAEFALSLISESHRYLSSVPLKKSFKPEFFQSKNTYMERAYTKAQRRQIEQLAKFVSGEINIGKNSITDRTRFSHWANSKSLAKDCFPRFFGRNNDLYRIARLSEKCAGSKAKEWCLSVKALYLQRFYPDLNQQQKLIQQIMTLLRYLLSDNISNLYGAPEVSGSRDHDFTTYCYFLFENNRRIFQELVKIAEDFAEDIYDGNLLKHYYSIFTAIKQVTKNSDLLIKFVKNRIGFLSKSPATLQLAAEDYQLINSAMNGDTKNQIMSSLKNCINNSRELYANYRLMECITSFGDHDTRLRLLKKILEQFISINLTDSARFLLITNQCVQALPTNYQAQWVDFLIDKYQSSAKNQQEFYYKIMIDYVDQQQHEKIYQHRLDENVILCVHTLVQKLVDKAPLTEIQETLQKFSSAESNKTQFDAMVWQRLSDAMDQGSYPQSLRDYYLDLVAECGDLATRVAFLLRNQDKPFEIVKNIWLKLAKNASQNFAAAVESSYLMTTNGWNSSIQKLAKWQNLTLLNQNQRTLWLINILKKPQNYNKYCTTHQTNWQEITEFFDQRDGVIAEMQIKQFFGEQNFSELVSAFEHFVINRHVLIQSGVFHNSSITNELWSLLYDKLLSSGHLSNSILSKASLSPLNAASQFIKYFDMSHLLIIINGYKNSSNTLQQDYLDALLIVMDYLEQKVASCMQAEVSDPELLAQTRNLLEKILTDVFVSKDRLRQGVIQCKYALNDRARQLIALLSYDKKDVNKINRELSKELSKAVEVSMQFSEEKIPILMLGLKPVYRYKLLQVIQNRINQGNADEREILQTLTFLFEKVQSPHSQMGWNYQKSIGQLKLLSNPASFTLFNTNKFTHENESKNIMCNSK